jgi:hypothetical protein
MKNIHILPTDKPSRLSKDENNKIWLSINFKYGINDNNKQHIYITSDEEIKDVRQHNGKWQLEQGQILNKFPNYLTDLSECKLVIMTTDEDLIKDGVQSIDDTFLEWFVKNPNCEFVDLDTFSMGNKVLYNVVFPKEKQIKCYCGHTITCDCEPLQETIEEAAEKYAELSYYNGDEVNAFIDGVKYQSKRMYSEDEVKEIIKLSCEEGMLIQRTINDKVKIPYMRIKDFTIRIFEKFKKK